MFRRIVTHFQAFFFSLRKLVILKCHLIPYDVFFFKAESMFTLSKIESFKKDFEAKYEKIACEVNHVFHHSTCKFINMI
jgi:hypothetical protein